MPDLPEVCLKYFHEKEGFCHPDWDSLWDYTEAQVPESEWFQLWVDLAVTWLGRLRARLGGSYRVIESENFFILTAAEDRLVAEAGRFYEKTLDQIMETLNPHV